MHFKRSLPDSWNPPNDKSPSIKTPKRSLWGALVCSRENECSDLNMDTTGHHPFFDLKQSLSQDSGLVRKKPFEKPEFSSPESVSKSLFQPSSSLLSHWNQCKPSIHAPPKPNAHSSPPSSPCSTLSVKSSPTLHDFFRPVDVAIPPISSSQPADFPNKLKSPFENIDDSFNIPISLPSSVNNILTDNGELCQLPCVETGKDALKRISPSTLVDLINGTYDHLYDEKLVIDCRFRYEYDGGHINNALNINSMNHLEEFLLSNPLCNKRIVLVFHCEYSSYRAPRSALYLRKQDRIANIHDYPRLFYPEIYILKGGYREFFMLHKESCVPQDYIEMNHSLYREELRREMSLFKKSWKHFKSFSNVPMIDDDFLW